VVFADRDASDRLERLGTEPVVVDLDVAEVDLGALREGVGVLEFEELGSRVAQSTVRDVVADANQTSGRCRETGTALDIPLIYVTAAHAVRPGNVPVAEDTPGADLGIAREAGSRSRALVDVPLHPRIDTANLEHASEGVSRTDVPAVITAAGIPTRISRRNRTPAGSSKGKGCRPRIVVPVVLVTARNVERSVGVAQTHAPHARLGGRLSADLAGSLVGVRDRNLALEAGPARGPVGDE